MLLTLKIHKAKILFQQANENGSLNCKSQSENNSSLVSHGSHSSRNSETTHKESEEGHVFCLPAISKY